MKRLITIIQAAKVLTCIGFFLFVLHVVCCEFWAAAIFQQELVHSNCEFHHTGYVLKWPSNQAFSQKHVFFLLAVVFVEGAASSCLFFSRNCPFLVFTLLVHVERML